MVTHGLIEGKKQSKTTVAEPKNVGRSNETTAEQQAILEAQSKWQHQLDRGYFQTKEEALGAVDTAPMKAQSFDDQGHKIIYPVYLQPKLNGCFGYNTKIQTAEGYKSIGEIVENKLPIKVASYNEETGMVELKRVVNWFNNGDKPQKEWLLFADKQRITKNHKVWADGEWTPAEDLSETSQLYGANYKALGIVAGMLMGDSVAAIEKRRRSLQATVSWRLSFSVCEADELFGDCKSQLLSEVTWSKVGKMSGYNKPQFVFTSDTLSATPFPLDVFYDIDKNSENYGRRCEISPKELKKIFTDETLAIWYMDDGNLSYNNGNPLTPRAHISVARYSRETVEGFVWVLQKLYNVHPTITGKPGRLSLSFSTPDTAYLLWRISKIAGNMLKRKIPEGILTEQLKPQSWYTHVKNNIGGVYPYGEADAKYGAYDIEVEGNHNYFAEGILVHNCRHSVNSEGKAQSKAGLETANPVHWDRGFKLLQAFGFLRDGLDGEVYAGLKSEGGLSLQEIVSAFRKENENTHKLRYFVYDIPMAGTFEQRAQRLAELHDRITRWEAEGIFIPIQVVWTGMANTPEEADIVYEHFVGLGYEGMMYRNAKGLYEFGKRSCDLQKRKPRATAEAKVLSVRIDKNDCGVLTCELETGVTFDCLMRKDSHPTINYRLFENAQQLIGKYIEFEMECLSDSGVPTKCVGIGIREVNPETFEPLN